PADAARPRAARGAAGRARRPGTGAGPAPDRPGAVRRPPAALRAGGGGLLRPRRHRPSGPAKVTRGGRERPVGRGASGRWSLASRAVAAEPEAIEKEEPS